MITLSEFAVLRARRLATRVLPGFLQAGRKLPGRNWVKQTLGKKVKNKFQQVDPNTGKVIGQKLNPLQQAMQKQQKAITQARQPMEKAIKQRRDLRTQALDKVKKARDKYLNKQL